MATRPAAKAQQGWYDRDPVKLKVKLDDYLSRVPETIDGYSLPIKGARIIIAPHAGYSYSGPCAAWAYSCLDLSNAKRVFVLGPSHTYYLRGCAMSKFAKYATPFGDLVVDQETVKKVKYEGDFVDIPNKNETAEHSLEMHLPYLYKMCERTFQSEDEFPKIVPIMVGDGSLEEEQEFGSVLAPYLMDPENAFIISSDFCHWGDDNFGYSPYSPDNSIDNLISLRSSRRKPTGPPIHETIKLIDEAAMDAVKSGSHEAFVTNLAKTKNTVCGRHPIGVAMAAMELFVPSDEIDETQIEGADKPKETEEETEEKELDTKMTEEEPEAEGKADKIEDATKTVETNGDLKSDDTNPKKEEKDEEIEGGEEKEDEKVDEKKEEEVEEEEGKEKGKEKEKEEEEDEDKKASNDEQTKQPRFSIIQYNRSNLVEYPDDMSVSYVSAYAILRSAGKPQRGVKRRLSQ